MRAATIERSQSTNQTAASHPRALTCKNKRTPLSKQYEPNSALNFACDSGVLLSSEWIIRSPRPTNTARLVQHPAPHCCHYHITPADRPCYLRIAQLYSCKVVLTPLSFHTGYHSTALRAPLSYYSSSSLVSPLSSSQHGQRVRSLSTQLHACSLSCRERRPSPRLSPSSSSAMTLVTSRASRSFPALVAVLPRSAAVITVDPAARIAPRLSEQYPLPSLCDTAFLVTSSSSSSRATEGRSGWDPHAGCTERRNDASHAPTTFRRTSLISCCNAHSISSPSLLLLRLQLYCTACAGHPCSSLS